MDSVYNYREYEVIPSLDASSIMDEYNFSTTDSLQTLNHPDTEEDNIYEQIATRAMSPTRTITLRYECVDSLHMSQSHVYIEEIRVKDTQ